MLGGVLVLSLAGGLQTADAPLRGALVEEVPSGTIAARAGLEPGDVVLSWSRKAIGADAPAASGDLQTPLDLAEVEVEELPRGGFELIGLRGEQEKRWTLLPGRFGFVAGPRLRGALLESYEKGRALAATSLPEAAEVWGGTAEAAIATGEPRIGIWLLWAAGQRLIERNRWPEAERVLGLALTAAEQAHDTRAQILVLRQQWRVRLYTGRFAEAEETIRRAIALEPPGETLSLARSLGNLALALLFKAQAPGVADDEVDRAFRITQKLAPDSLAMVDALSFRGEAAMRAERLSDNEDCQRRSLAILDKIEPDGKSVIKALTRLGTALTNRGDLAGSDGACRRAMPLAEKMADDGRSALANALECLGTNAAIRMDRGACEDYLQRALALQEELGLADNTANLLNTLGTCASSDAAAAEYFERALALQERIAPDSPLVAQELNNLGMNAIKAGDLVAADRYLHRALETLQRADLADTSFTAAYARAALAKLAYQRKNFKTASEEVHRALELLSRLGPSGTWEELNLSGEIELARGEPEVAVGEFLRSIDGLESRLGRIGGAMESASHLLHETQVAYHNAMTALLALHREAEALHVLERSRARLWLARLAERDLGFRADLPEDLARERTELDRTFDRVESEMGKLDPLRDEKALATHQARLRELREAQEQMMARVAKASPGLAALQYPKPLDLAGVLQALDPGTTLLAYSVGEKETLLFAVSSPGAPDGALAVFSLPISAKELRDKVQKLRDAFAPASHTPHDGAIQAAVELYDLLIRPAQARIDASQRLLLSPDGPLHSLPFAALARRDEATGRATYLVEEKAIHITPSVTVYRQLRERRIADRPIDGKLVAFGDPMYVAPGPAHSALVQDAQVRAFSGGAALSPLPAARDEVLSIARLFKGAAEVHVGAEATEERAKAIDPAARYVHFACHAFLDEQLPLNSGLVLSLPEPAHDGDNGLLQAWEVFDHVRVNADLVTLSACRTALGTEMGGEGLVGLTRAFHHAGARSVLASLWAVSDKSTARLMRSFYRHVTAGESLDESLRTAQLELMHHSPGAGGAGRWSRPFYWAAFQLSGDWRK